MTSITCMKKKRTFPAVRIAAALLLLSSLFSLTAAASEGAPPVGTSNSYVYDSYDNPQTSTEGYVTDRVLRGTDFGAGDMQNPQDLFVRGTCCIFWTRETAGFSGYRRISPFSPKSG